MFCRWHILWDPKYIRIAMFSHCYTYVQCKQMHWHACVSNFQGKSKRFKCTWCFHQSLMVKRQHMMKTPIKWHWLITATLNFFYCWKSHAMPCHPHRMAPPLDNHNNACSPEAALLWWWERFPWGLSSVTCSILYDQLCWVVLTKITAGLQKCQGCLTSERWHSRLFLSY